MHLFGNSLGGAVCTRVAATRPELVRSLTLVAPAMPDLWPRPATARFPALCVPKFGSWVLSRVQKMSPQARVEASIATIYFDGSRVHPDRIAADIAETERRDQLGYGAAVLIRCARSIVAEYLRRGSTSLWRDAARVSAPSLIMYGSHDRIVDPRMAGRAARTFRRARVVVLPGPGTSRRWSGRPRWRPSSAGCSPGMSRCPSRLCRAGVPARAAARPYDPIDLESTVSLPPLVSPADELSVDEVKRYSRHLIIPDVGMTGQKRLKNAKVLVVGAGGLGSPALLYLAAAGVGTLGIVDFDVVDESNLQRQIIHGVSDVGRLKAESARDSIGEINPYVDVELHAERLDSDNAMAIFGRTT